MLKESDLHDYQKASVKHIMENSHAGLFLEMGLGKTVSTLTALNKLIYEELEINNCLVIAPKRVAETVWDAEIKKWQHIKHLKISKVIGTAKKRRAALAEPADIYIMGRDNVTWLCGLYGGSMLPFDMLVIDELSSFKSPKSIRFKSLRHAQPSFKRVLGLTGTPSPNGLIDLWSQIYLLDRGERLEKYITKYREKYFSPGRTNGAVVYNYKMQEGSEAKIQKQIKDICISMSAEDYLTLPGRIDNNVFLEMPTDLKKKYQEFEKEKVLELVEKLESQDEFFDDVEISAVNAAGLYNKLLQFANGAVYDSDKNWHEIHNLKIEALKEILEDANGKPVLLAYTYKHDLERIMEHLKKYKPVKLAGQDTVDDWNAGNIKLMIMHPASGGHGLNLQAGGNIIVWFGHTWSLELEQQFNARLNRQGQKEVVVINRLIVKDTMDEEVIKRVDGKASKQKLLMDAVKATIRKYLK